MEPASGAAPSGLERALAALLDLARQSRQAQSEAELDFLLVNNSLQLLPYRMAALWRQGPGIEALSGLVRPEANAPYAQWLRAVCKHLQKVAGADGMPVPFTSLDLPSPVADAWGEWWPRHALWIPLSPSHWNDAKPAQAAAPAAQGRSGTASAAAAALVLVRDQAWSGAEQELVREWGAIWWHAWVALRRRPRNFGFSAWRADPAKPGGTRRGWRPGWWITAGLIAAGFVPVPLSVLAAGELVPREPVVVRAPMDGVIDAFHVQPNEDVAQGQMLFGFDEALTQSRLRVAQQSLATANAEYRQTAQQSLADARARPQLAALAGKIEERAAEVAFLRERLQRSRVLAPRAGIVLFDDPSQWVGRPVTTGERILRIAAPHDVEVEAWLPVGDAIKLEPGTPVKLFLNARPMEPVVATLRYMAHEAAQRPDGSHAYRLRASLNAPAGLRVGLKGTARLDGERVPLAYWIARRPIATVRTWIGR